MKCSRDRKNRNVRGMVEGLESRMMLSALAAHAAKSVVTKPHVLPVMRIVITQEPADVQAGLSETMKVSLEDANGDVVTTTKDKVTLKILKGPKGGGLFGKVTVAAVNGVATFNAFSFGKIGAYTLKAVDGNKSASATPVNVALGPPTKLKIVSTFPVNTSKLPATGSLGPVVVDVLDGGGNVVNTPTSLRFSLVSNGNGWTPSGTFGVGDKITQATSGATGVVTAQDSRGVTVNVTSGTFDNADVITDTVTAATLTATGTVAAPSAPASTVSLVVNTTLSTETTLGTVTQAASGSGTTVNGVATITPTATTTGTTTALTLKPGWYSLVVTDGSLIRQQMLVFVR